MGVDQVVRMNCTGVKIAVECSEKCGGSHRVHKLIIFEVRGCLEEFSFILALNELRKCKVCLENNIMWVVC